MRALVDRPSARARPPALTAGAAWPAATGRLAPAPAARDVRAAAAARRNDTSKGPRHETRPSAANARSRSRRREGPAPGIEADPLVPVELLQEAQGTEAYRYARALSAALSARRRPLALRAALALAVARPARLLPQSAGGVGVGVGGGGGGGGGRGGSSGVRPAALAARIAQLSETLAVSVADAAELLAGATGPGGDDEGDDGFGEEEEEEGQRSDRRRRASGGRRRAVGGGGGGGGGGGPPPAALEDVLPLRLLRAAEALVVALELDLDDEDDALDADADDAAQRLAIEGLPGVAAAASAAASAASAAAPGASASAADDAAVAIAPPLLPLDDNLPPEPPADPRAAALRLAARAIALRPSLLDAPPLDVRRRAAAAAAALGLSLRAAGRALFVREPALMDVAPAALARRLSSLARALGPPGKEAGTAGGEAAEAAAALAVALREPRALLPASRALAANVGALPRALGLRGGAAPGLSPVAAVLLHAPTLALVPAAEVARRLEALRRLLPPPPSTPVPDASAGASPPPWPLLSTRCGLVYDPRILALPTERLAERARHLQRLERLAAEASSSGGGTDGQRQQQQQQQQHEQRQRRARLLSVSSAALDGWCADALHLSPALNLAGEAAAAARLIRGAPASSVFC